MEYEHEYFVLKITPPKKTKREREDKQQRSALMYDVT